MESLELSVVEFFSGIGGMRYALESVPNVCIKKCISYEISHLCNSVYQYNFHNNNGSVEQEIRTKSIDKISCSELAKIKADVWLMSPPCQPYTRRNTSSKRDLSDPRTAALINLINILKELDPLPRTVLLENVVGFEESQSYKLWTDALISRGYTVESIVLSPTAFGTPQERPRFFSLATLKGHSVCSIENGVKKAKASSKLLEKLDVAPGKQIRKLSEFLLADWPSGRENERDENASLMKKLLKPSSFCMDIVTADSTRCGCFTKSYGRFARGSGSILLENASLEEHKMFMKSREDSKQNNASGNDNQISPTLEWYIPYQDRLRLISPREIANLLGFPDSFSFPVEISVLRKKYAMLGNSLHIPTVTSILRLAFEK